MNSLKKTTISNLFESMEIKFENAMNSSFSVQLCPLDEVGETRFSYYEPEVFQAKNPYLVKILQIFKIIDALLFSFFGSQTTESDVINESSGQQSTQGNKHNIQHKRREIKRTLVSFIIVVMKPIAGLENYLLQIIDNNLFRLTTVQIKS